MGKVVKAPFKQGQVSIGPQVWDVKNSLVVGLSPDDVNLAELKRAFGLTIESDKSPAKQSPAPPSPPKKTNEGGDK